MDSINLPLLNIKSHIGDGLKTLQAAQVGGLVVSNDNQYALLHAAYMRAAANRGAQDLADVEVLGQSTLFIGKPSGVIGSIAFKTGADLALRHQGIAVGVGADFSVELIDLNTAVVTTRHPAFRLMLATVTAWWCTGPQTHIFFPPPNREDGAKCPTRGCVGILRSP
jgi:hypothetical protein